MRVILSMLFTLSAIVLAAQPEACDQPPEMTSFCQDACIICDIDGFRGRHDANIVGEAPPGFAGECTFVAHNMQWIAFIAGSENLSVNLAVSNCDLGYGLEFGLYEGINCQNYRRISNCFGGAAGIIQPGQSGTITNNEPLLIGQYYYIAMDGGLGDNCDWTFAVLSGSTSVLPLEESGTIVGPDQTCPELMPQYVVNAPIGATEFDWTLDGNPVGENNDTISFSYPEVGSYTLCVKAFNRCEEAPPTCITVNVATVPVTELIEIVCEGACFEIADTLICETGFYDFNLQNINGCDSLVLLDLTQLPTPVSNLDLLLCAGDTFFVGNMPFVSTGIYQESIPSFQDCDSIVNLDLRVIVCEIRSEKQIESVDCYGATTGALNFSITNGTPPFTYEWEQLNGFRTGNGNINTLNEDHLLNSLSAGTYSVTIEDDFDNFNVIIANINQPNPLIANLEPLDQNGFGVSCPEFSDGSISVMVSGGNQPYIYNWSTGANGNNTTQLSSGDYAISVMDRKGCMAMDQVTLTAPVPIEINAVYENPDCSGLATGSISVLNTMGGTGTYIYQFAGQPETSATTFIDLTEGTYEITATDENGCFATTSGALTASEIPVIDLGEDQQVQLGEEINFRPFVNDIQMDSIRWVASTELDCDTCLVVNTLPLNNASYILKVVSEDGCIGVDTVFVTVDKLREFYVPNAFSPNADGVNDYFTLFGGVEVEVILELTVFDRWGGIRYQGKNLTPRNELLGWNGGFGAEPAANGVYVWMAEILFIDGEKRSYGGDVLLVR